MVKRIAFANQKGGVGKSTFCTQIAFYLALKDKKRVLVIDMDAQGNSTSTLLRQEASRELTGTESNALFQSEPIEVKPMKLSNGIDLIGTRKNDRDSYDLEAIELSQAVNPRKHLKTIEDQYDYILFDCPPSLGRKLISVLLTTEYVVCPVKLSGYAVDGLEGLFKTLFDIKKNYNKNLKILGAIINEYDRSSSHNEALEMVRETIPSLLFKNIVCHRSPIDTASLKGEPIWKIRNGWRAATEIEAVVKELKSKLQ